MIKKILQKQKKNWARIFSTLLAVFFLVVVNIQTVFSQWDKSKYDVTGLPKMPLAKIIENIAFWLLAIFGFIAVIGFVISGIMYLVAAGDEDTQERAKRAMYYSIIGVIVGLVGLVVVYAVNALLNASSGI
jgi:cytochrome bd-type quinol oxidase subunit 2